MVAFTFKNRQEIKKGMGTVLNCYGCPEQNTTGWTV